MAQWTLLTERTQGTYTADQFEAAAYRLLSEQVLYAADRRSRVAYALVEQFEREFAQVLAPFGVKLRVNRQLRYACATPSHEKSTPASEEQTLLALVLRKVYDEAARMGEMNDDGEVVCDLVALEEKYRQDTGRALAKSTKLEQLLSTLKRWGIARTSEEDETGRHDVDQPFVVVIRPAIADVLGEQALLRLALWGKPSSASLPTAGDAQ